MPCERRRACAGAGFAPRVVLALACASVAPLALLASCSGTDPILGLRAPNPPRDSGGRDGADSAPPDARGDGARDGEAGAADAEGDSADGAAQDTGADGAQDSGWDAPLDAQDDG